MDDEDVSEKYEEMFRTTHDIFDIQDFFFSVFLYIDRTERISTQDVCGIEIAARC